MKSFGFAMSGVKSLIRTQPHARFHLLASVVVVTAGWWFEVSRFDWMMLALAIGIVWTAEAMNTAVEFLGDAITGEHHPLIGRAKDMAAGGVLLAAITSAVIGLLIFLPRI